MIDPTDVIVIGAGPSGLMCAVQASERGLSTLVLERQELAGAKFCYSAMGAAAISNIDMNLEHFHGRRARFVTDALNHLPLPDLRAWFEHHGVEIEEADFYGLIQPCGGGGEVIGALVDSLQEHGGELRTGVRVVSVERAEGAFTVALEDGEVQSARAVVIASGAPNLPQLGGTDDAYRLAGAFGHTVEPVAPSLVGLMVGEDWVRDIPGLWMDVELKLLEGKRILGETVGSMLFTRAGLVGEGIYNIARDVEPGLARGAELQISVNFHPGMERGDVHEWMRRVFGERTRERVIQALDLIVPECLGAQFVKQLRVKPTTRVMQLDERQRDQLFQAMIDTRLNVSGTLGMRAAEGVTGGVSVRDVDPRTFQSKRAPGLFVVGQALSVCGDWGGFEAHYALASGCVAGRSLLR